MMNKLRRAFRPEFLNRLDEIVLFPSARSQRSAAHRRRAAHAFPHPSGSARPHARGSATPPRTCSPTWASTPRFGARPLGRALQQAPGEPAGPANPGGKLRARRHHRGGHQQRGAPVQLQGRSARERGAGPRERTWRPGVRQARPLAMRAEEAGPRANGASISSFALLVGAAALQSCSAQILSQQVPRHLDEPRARALHWMGFVEP